MELTDKNLYAYCDNNPVMRADTGGDFWHIVAGAAVGAVIGAVTSVVSQVVSGQDVNWTAVAISAGSGALSGAINAAVPCMGAVATGVVQGTISAATYAATEKFAYGRDPSLEEVVKVGVVSGVTAGVSKYVQQSTGAVQCFIAGTVVATANGQKNIEDIQPGEYVWASDPDTGETALKQVVQTFVNEATELVHVSVNGEEIVCTNEHPFYSPVKGWIAACDLRAGDILVLVSGEYVTVEKVQHEILDTPVFVYNFEVEDFHTYYVGTDSVLVHNKCVGKPTSPNQMQKQVERGQAPNTVIRVDNPKTPGQSPHIHFKDGTAMNMDGSVHDAMKGIHNLTSSERIWLFKNGWRG